MPDPARANEPIRELIAGWRTGEERMAGEYDATLSAIDEVVRELESVGARMEQRAAEREAEFDQQAERWRQQQETDQQHRKRLEHDLALARSRVREVERHLQQRTEELLEAQTANNTLAAQLQEITDPLPVIVPSDAGDPQPSAPAAADAGEEAQNEAESSVSERFAKLRNQSA
ncbi:MAG: hypothetical protein AAFV43_01500 [Planctomycetota bacterium]